MEEKSSRWNATATNAFHQPNYQRGAIWPDSPILVNQPTFLAVDKPGLYPSYAYLRYASYRMHTARLILAKVNALSHDTCPAKCKLIDAFSRKEIVSRRA